MSTFFEDQIQAKKRTKLLLGLYFGGVICIILSIYIAALFLLDFNPDNVSNNINGSPSLWRPELFTSTTIIVTMIILVASAVKIQQLGGGGAAVAIMLGGRMISPNTQDPVERKVINVVEEMAIAAGMKVPPVYLMENEPSINAFAAGTSPGNAVIGISKGCLELLTRDEFQGVIAHEFSHILNGDMKLNIRIIGVLHGILCLAILGRVLLRSGSTSRRSDNRGGGSLVVFGLALLVIGYLGVFFSTLIRMAVSRQREYLADASAVQFTRNPEGISGALKKIGALAQGSIISHPRAEEASHMYFADGIRKSFSSLLSTHPPLLDRLKEIDHRFDGFIPLMTYDAMKEKAMLRLQKDLKTTEPQSQEQATPLDPLLDPIQKTPLGDIIGTVGAFTASNLQSAQNLISSLPDKVREAAHDPFSACILIYTLLLDKNKSIRDMQLDLLENKLPSNVHQELKTLIKNTGSIPQQHFLSILDLCIPALESLTQKQYEELKETAQTIIYADNHVDLYEYALQAVLTRHFDNKFYPEKFAGQESKTLKELVRPTSDLFLGLAVLGNPDNPEAAKQAYNAAVNHCGIPEKYRANFDSLPSINLNFLDQALSEFTNVDYEVREVILRACATCISIDDQVNNHELALIRAIADSLDCPVPFFEV